MIAAVAVILSVALMFEAAYLWIGRIHDIRAEQAYWYQRDHRPYLYDWEVDGDA